MSDIFDDDLHVFKAPEFTTIIEQAIDFFAKSPLQKFQPTYHMNARGVYGLYYFGDYELYTPIAEKNKISADQPIYIGKAVSSGKRTGLLNKNQDAGSVLARLWEHARSINAVNNLKIDDFQCKFVFLGKNEEDLIEVLEARLLKKFQPLWNAPCLAGFGNHDPGSGRHMQQRSPWDTLHPGRPWAMRLRGKLRDEAVIVENVRRFLKS